MRCCRNALCKAVGVAAVATNEAAAVRGVEEAAAGDVGVDATFGTIDLLPVRVHIEFSSAARWLVACHLTRELHVTQYCLLRHSNRRIALAAVPRDTQCSNALQSDDRVVGGGRKK